MIKMQDIFNNGTFDMLDNCRVFVEMTKIDPYGVSIALTKVSPVIIGLGMAISIKLALLAKDFFSEKWKLFVGDDQNLFENSIFKCLTVLGGAYVGLSTSLSLISAIGEKICSLSETNIMMIYN
jgi:hypothetical protein